METLPTVQVTPEFIAAVAGIVISLICSYFPVVSLRFAELDEGQKQLIMIGFMLMVTIVLFLLGCSGLILIPAFVCNQQTAISFFWLFFYAVVANQTTHRISPKTTAVKAVLASKYGGC